MVRAAARNNVMGYSYRARRRPTPTPTRRVGGRAIASWHVRTVCGLDRPAELMAEFEVDEIFDGLPGPDYNVAPTVAVPAVFERRCRRTTGEVRRRLAPLVWGLVPSWAKDPSIGSRMINARVETVAEKPAFRKAFSARRCLLPADGFYEWYALEAADAAPRTGQAQEAAVLHPPGRRWAAGDGRHLRDLARSDQGPGRRLRLAADLHGDHHRGHRRRRAHPRPDADGDPPGRGRRLAGPAADRSRARRWSCWR